MVPCVVLAAVAVSKLDILDELINVGQSILVCVCNELVMC